MKKINKKEWTTVSDVQVRWGDLDAFNHVNNTIYFKYFEMVRIEYFIQLKWMVSMENTGIGPILANTSCQFLLPITYPDQLQVGIRAKKLGRSSIIHEYAVFSDKLGLAAQGESVVVCYDFPNQRKIEFPEELRKKILEIEVLDL